MSDPTTSFELAYSKDLSERTLRLKSKGVPISLADVPCDFHAKALHIAPIANEVSIEVVERLRECGECCRLIHKGCFEPSTKQAMQRRTLRLINEFLV